MILLFYELSPYLFVLRSYPEDNVQGYCTTQRILRYGITLGPEGSSDEVTQKLRVFYDVPARLPQSSILNTEGVSSNTT